MLIYTDLNIQIKGLGINYIYSNLYTCYDKQKKLHLQQVIFGKWYFSGLDNTRERFQAPEKCGYACFTSGNWHGYAFRKTYMCTQ